MLETASILHVTLLVFLRLKAVKRPMEEEKNEQVIRIISVFSVWSYLRRDPPQPCHHDTMIGTKQYKSVSGHEMDPPSSF